MRGSADIDLVVFFNGLSSISDLEASRKHLLDLLKEKVQSYGPWRGRIALQNRTLFSLCYTLDGQEIDILPACDIIKGVFCLFVCLFVCACVRACVRACVCV